MAIHKMSYVAVIGFATIALGITLRTAHPASPVRDRQPWAAVPAAMVVPHGPAANLRPGDWMCEACGGHNFASRNSCFTCNRGNPALVGGAGGAAAAPVGSGANSVPLGQPADPMMAAASMASTQAFSQIGVGAFNQGAASSAMKMGDWMCQSCGGHNFANKVACFTCKNPKPF